MNKAGVYMIQSISYPKRVYVGSTFRDIDERLKNHRNQLNENKHHSPQLQNHYNKYGKDDLVFEIIESGEYLDKNHLLAREQGWYEPFQFNNKFLPYLNSQLIAGSCLGVKRSKETRDKQSKTCIEQFKNGRISSFKGKHHSEETKELQSKRKLGTHWSEENKLNIKGRPSSFKGKHHSEETKELQSKRMLGIHRSPITEFKKGYIPYNKGIKQKIIICPYCGISGGINIMKRWHFDNCKIK